MKIAKYFMALAVVVMLCSPPVMAELPSGAISGAGPAVKIRAFLDKLALTDVQKTQAATLLKEHRSAIREKVDAFRDARKELGTVINKDEFNEEEVRAAHKQLAHAGEELAVEAAQLINQLRSVLSEEQKVAIGEARENVIKRIDQRLAFGRALFDVWVDQQAAQ